MGVVYSIVFVCSAWVALQLVAPFSRYGRAFSWTINIIFFAKIFFGLAHFYFVFAPAADITSASQIADANFPGDLVAIHNATLIFNEEWAIGGLYHAIFSDYYRAFNNYGVPIIYGALYRAFGPYATVAVPINALAMGTACAVLGATGEVLNADNRTTRNAVLILFVMPLFFVGVPNYRDQFMILLLVLTAYSSLYAARSGHWSSIALLIPLSALLGSLRQPYMLVPSVFGLISLWCSSKSDVNLIRGLLLLVGAAIFVYATSQINQELTSLGSNAFSKTVEFSSIDQLSRFSSVLYYPVTAAFSFLAPMPWWQSVELSLLVHQVFNYPQTLLSLTIIVALVVSRTPGKGNPGYFGLILMAAFIYLLAFGGSLDLGARYFQVGLPLLLLPGVHALQGRWKKCLMISGSVVAAAHAYLLVMN